MTYRSAGLILVMPGFPLRLLSPYRGFTDEDAARCRAVMEARWPQWLPD